jgi:hypothetical protein
MVYYRSSVSSLRDTGLGRCCGEASDKRGRQRGVGWWCERVRQESLGSKNLGTRETREGRQMTQGARDLTGSIAHSEPSGS